MAPEVQVTETPEEEKVLYKPRHITSLHSNERNLYRAIPGWRVSEIPSKDLSKVETEKPFTLVASEYTNLAAYKKAWEKARGKSTEPNITKPEAVVFLLEPLNQEEMKQIDNAGEIQQEILTQADFQELVPEGNSYSEV